jgi:PAS domain S-box-containing protein
MNPPRIFAGNNHKRNELSTHQNRPNNQYHCSCTRALIFLRFGECSDGRAKAEHHRWFERPSDRECLRNGSERVKDTLEQRVLIGFGIILGILLIVLVVAVRNNLQSIQSSDWVNHTHAVILETDAILSALHAAEAAQRNYLISGDARDHAAARIEFARVNEHLQVAKVLTADHARQQQRLAALETLIRKRVQFSETTLQVRQEKGFEAARELLGSRDRGELDEIRKLVANLKQEENQLLQQRDQVSHRNARTTRWIVFTGVAFNFVLLALIFWLLRIDLELRRKAALALQEANEVLELKVQQRTADLAKANESLALENLEQRWAHAAMERRFRHDEMILNSMGEGLLVISSLGNVLRANHAAMRLGGWDSSEITGKPVASILAFEVGGAPRDWKEHPIFKAIQQGYVLLDEQAWLKGRHGELVPITYRVHPVEDAEKMVGAILTFTWAKR